MADCPKCGRQLTVAGSCIKCGTVNDRSKWYAIAEEDAEEKPRTSKPKRTVANRPRPPTSAARKDWYQAAGMEVPPDHVAEPAAQSAPGEVPLDPNDHHAWAEVSRGRKDPPFGKIAAGLGLGVCVAGLVAYARCGVAPSADVTAVELPRKFIHWNHSYGFKIDPPSGFKQQPQPEMPDFARGVHEDLTTLIAYSQPQSGIDAYYFAEVREHTTLDAYAQLSVSDLGNLTSLTTFPDGIKAYPTKGYLIDMGARKALVYVSSAAPDRYFTIWVLSPSTMFAKNEAEIEAAARAFSIVEPDGPRPGTHFAPPE